MSRATDLLNQFNEDDFDSDDMATLQDRIGKQNNSDAEDMGRLQARINRLKDQEQENPKRLPSTIKYTVSTPSGNFSLSADRIMCNIPGEFNPHNVRPWVIYSDLGALCVVWASDEQDAFDEAWDADMLRYFAIDDEYLQELEDEGEEVTRLGNADEPADLTNAGIDPVNLSASQELKDAFILWQDAYEKATPETFSNFGGTLADLYL